MKGIKGRPFKFFSAHKIRLLFEILDKFQGVLICLCLSEMFACSVFSEGSFFCLFQYFFKIVHCPNNSHNKLQSFPLQKIEESGQYKSNSVRFCYNAISDLENLSSTLEHFLENPLELEWLDLSFNDISTIDKVNFFVQYPTQDSKLFLDFAQLLNA